MISHVQAQSQVVDESLAWLVVTAIATAIAGFAAMVTALLDYSRHRRSVQPLLQMQVNRHPDETQSVMVVNAGPGLAVGARSFGMDLENDVPFFGAE